MTASQRAPITFRPAGLDDLDRVVAKVHEFAPRMLSAAGASERQIDEWLTVNAARWRWRERLEADNAAVYIGESDDVLVGLGYVQTFRDIDDVLAARFGGLYMRRPRQGIGTAIVEHLLGQAKRLGVDYVQLETAEGNDAMRNLATRYGFAEHERYQHPLIGLPFYKYRLALTDAGEDFVLDVGSDEDGETGS